MLPSQFSADQIRNWYCNPGEKLRSIGFYVNPYKRWNDAKFRHIFAFDNDNLYIGQFSVYPDHIDEIFGKEFPVSKSSKETSYRLPGKIEYGMIHIRKRVVILFDFLESKNIIFLNRRLRTMAQRFYDYGMPPNSIMTAPGVGLGNPTLRNILKGSPLEKPAELV
jgi:hypothetical protein